MPKGRTKKITPEQQQEIIKEVEAKANEVSALIGKLAFHRSEAITFKLVENVTYNEQTVSVVGVTYVVPTTEAFEVRAADELHLRLLATVEGWKDWVQKELHPDEQVPF